MGTIKPDELLKSWSLGNMTAEMAVGHLIQNLVKLQTAIENINITLYTLCADVDSLIAHTGMMPNPKGKKKSPKKG